MKLMVPQVLYKEFGLTAENVAQKAARLVEFYADRPVPSKIIRPF
jgi:hypothetical protein